MVACGFNQVYCLTMRALMLFEVSTRRNLTSAGCRCVFILAVVLQPLLTTLALAQSEPANGQSSNSQTAPADVAAVEDLESIYFGQAKDLPTVAGQVWSVALSPDGKT